MLTGRLVVKVQGGSGWVNGKGGKTKVVNYLELAASHAREREDLRTVGKRRRLCQTPLLGSSAFAEREIFKDQELNCGTGWGLKVSKSQNRLMSCMPAGQQ